MPPHQELDEAVAGMAHRGRHRRLRGHRVRRLPGRHAIAGSRVFLLGGVPLGEQRVMWWNLMARTPEEIEAAVADWREGRFGAVAGYDGVPLPAPPLVAFRSPHRP